MLIDTPIDPTTSVVDEPINQETRAELPVSPIVPDEWSDGIIGLEDIYKQLSKLSQPDPDDDEFVPPSDYARNRVIDVVQSAAYGMMQGRHQFPIGDVTTDDNGGVRIEWWQVRDFCVTLVIGRDESAPSYVFEKLEHGHAGLINKRILPVRLASQLEKLAAMRGSNSE